MPLFEGKGERSASIPGIVIFKTPVAVKWYVQTETCENKPDVRRDIFCAICFIGSINSTATTPSPYKAAAKAVIALSPLPDLSTKGGEIFDDWWGKVLQIQKLEKQERISHFQVWKSRSVDANERLQL